MIFDNSSLDGTQFLWIYALFFGSALMLSVIFARLVRPNGEARTVTDVDELAVLRGGIDRLIEAASTRLLRARIIGFSRDRMVARTQGGAQTPIERAILSPLPARWHEVVASVRPEHDRIATRLIDTGLLLAKPQEMIVRMAQAVPFALLFAYGIDRWMLGDARDKPVGWLTMALVITGFVAIFRYASINRLTSSGQVVVRDAERLSARLRQAPTEPEMDRAVALFGTSVLALSAYGQFHRFRHPPGDSGTGSSGCGTTSDGGSSGGGCGGCGGD